MTRDLYRLFRVPAAAVMAFAAVPSLAGPIGNVEALKTWNLVVLGDLSSSSEVEGRTFVGGNLTGNSSNYSTRPVQSSSGAPAGLTVVGNVEGGHKNLNNGSGAVVGGNVQSGFNLNGSPQTVKVGGTISNTNVNQNTVISGLAASDPAFRVELGQQKSYLTTSMNTLSREMGALDGNSALTISGSRGVFNAVPDAKGLAVFNIDSAQLDRIGEIQFNLNGADTAIVNVSGKAIRLDDNFLGGTSSLGEHVIWNFRDAETLTMTTAWGGSVLAPNATARTYNQINGSAVFGNLEQNGKMSANLYSGGYYSAPPSPTPGSSGGTSGDTSSHEVPEPGMLVLFGLMVAGLILWVRRRNAGAS